MSATAKSLEVGIAETAKSPAAASQNGRERRVQVPEITQPRVLVSATGLFSFTLTVTV